MTKYIPKTFGSYVKERKHFLDKVENKIIQTSCAVLEINKLSGDGYEGSCCGISCTDCMLDINNWKDIEKYTVKVKDIYI